MQKYRVHHSCENIYGSELFSETRHHSYFLVNVKIKENANVQKYFNRKQMEFRKAMNRGCVYAPRKYAPLAAVR